jgi:hypothetical protein
MRRIFRGFCINQFGIGPLHYISSRSDFGFEFAEIFVIEKQLANSLTWRVGESLFKIFKFIIDLQNLQLNQPFKDKFSKK